MHKIFLVLLVFGVLFISGCGTKKALVKKEAAVVQKFQLDATVHPGDSLYAYVNNTWIAQNPIPSDYGRWSAFDSLRDKTLAQLLEIFKSAVSTPKNENEKLIGKFYAVAMDESAIEKAGVSPIRKDIDRIESLKTKEEISKEIATQHALGFAPFFSIGVWPDLTDSTQNLAEIWEGGLSLPEKSYYLDDERAEIRTKYVAHMTKMFELAGFSTEEASKKAANVLKIETLLAKASRAPEDERDVKKNFNKMDVSKLNTLASNVDWKIYFQTIGIPEVKTLTVGQPEFLTALNKVITDVPVEDVRDYLLWHWLSNSASYLSHNFVNEDFDFFQKTLSGLEKIKERYKRVALFMNNYLGEAVGQSYVGKYFPPEAKQRADALVKNILAAMRQHLQNVSWMTDSTKKIAIGKLDKMGVKIGYPVKWRDYSQVTVTDNYFQNVLSAMHNEFNYMIQKQGKLVDRTLWEMSPQTVNAYYNPSMNEIVFPAAILQAPYFDFTADDAVNYGAIGTVIGHEITHAFDDQGSKFDENGNLKDWWTKEDSDRFEKLTQQLVGQYDKYQVENGEYINGQLTLGENIADLGGVRIGYTAFRLTNPDDAKLIENMTPAQRFFGSFATIWSTNTRPEESLRLIKTDPHSPGRFRVDGTLHNVPEFFRAFNVTEKDSLFTPKDQILEIW